MFGRGTFRRSVKPSKKIGATEPEYVRLRDKLIHVHCEIKNLRGLNHAIEKPSVQRDVVAFALRSWRIERRWIKERLALFMLAQNQLDMSKYPRNPWILLKVAKL